MQITKGKIELRPIGHNGKVLFLSTRDYSYPENKEVLTEDFDQLLARCFVEGTDYHCTIPLVKSIQVVVMTNAVPAREMFADGTVKSDERIPYDELEKRYKQSIEELKVLSEELAMSQNKGGQIAVL